MNGYHNYQGQEYAYGPRCPYRDTCPMRTECPYCPHHMEGNSTMNPGYYGNMNMNMNMEMEYYVKDNAEPILYPYQNAAPVEYGNENLYPMTNNLSEVAGMESHENFPVNPHYNQYGYINPEENLHSPWANNNMYGNMGNPLPIPKCPYQ